MIATLVTLIALVFPSFVAPADAADGLSRRGFLLCSAALGVGTYVAMPHFSEQIKKNEERLDAILHQKHPDKRYLRTFLESQLMLVGELIFNNVTQRLTGLPLGMSPENAKKIGQEPPATLYVDAVLLAPILEELVFRWFPAKLRGDSHGDDWGAGVIAAALFALAHNKTKDGFDFSSIPATHYLSGIYSWYLMKRRGLSHAIVAHAAHNQTAVVLSWILGAFQDDE